MNSYKTLAIVAAVLLAAGSYQLFTLSQAKAIQEQQLVDYDRQVSDLLARIEQDSRERLDYERQIDSLDSELTRLRSELRVVSNRLTETEARVDPDYQELEAQIRRSITREIQAQDAANTLDPRVDLLRELSAMEPQEFSELLSLQGQFGPFLQALDADDERLEIIVATLGNLVAEQNQARQEVMRQAQAQQIGRREMRSVLRSTMSADSQRESLSYVLTEDELAVWDKVQQEQPRGRSRGMAFANGPVDSRVFRFDGQNIQGGSGSSGIITIQGEPGDLPATGEMIFQAVPISPPAPDDPR